MLVIIEGAERTGKSTLAKALEDEGFIYFKDIPTACEMLEDYKPSEMLNRLDAILNLLVKLNTIENIVIDRFHISNKVFEEAYRGNEFSGYRMLDRELSLMNTKLVLLERKIDKKYVEEHPKAKSEEALASLQKKFYYWFEKSQIGEKYRYDLAEHRIGDVVAEIVGKKEVRKEVRRRNTYDFYLASPFFNEEQLDRMNGILSILRKYGYKVYAPIEAGLVASNASDTFISEVFNSNVEAINHSKMVFAITDGKDMGTIWEAGYAYGIGKPVIYFAETLGDNPFNIMLSESGKGIFTRRIDVIDAAFTDEFYKKEKVNRE